MEIYFYFFLIHYYFFYTYIKTKDLCKSLELANTAAGYTASYENLNAFNGLKRDVFTRYN